MKTFNLMGFDWQCCMEGGRIIHEKYPYVFYDETKISTEKDVVKLTLGTPSQAAVEYWDGTTFYPQYGGGLLRSVDTFTYGTFSAEICMPKGKGLWSAFWLVGEGHWAEHGEIDINEGYSDDDYTRIFTPYFPWLNPSWKTTNNIHYAVDGEHKEAGSRSVSKCTQPYEPYSGFIKYECKWTPDEIIFSVGGKVVRRDKDAVKHFMHDQGDRMRVVFDLLCEDPEKHEVSMETPMLIRNFKYKPL